MTASIKSAISRYGNSAVIERGEERIKIKAFIEPMRRRHRPYINERLLSAGYFQNKYRLFIGDSRYPLERNDLIEMGEERFSVVLSENFVFQNENLYVWAILEEIKEMPEDEYDESNRG